MELLPHQLDFSAHAAPLPDGVSDEVYDMCRNITSPDAARRVLTKLQPLLKNYRADKNMAIACGLLLEKQRSDVDMAALWNDLQSRFPDDDMALRMLMRWYRRLRRVDEGIAYIDAKYPDRWFSLPQARKSLMGLGELKAWGEIDTLMESVLVFQPQDRAIRMAYIKALSEQLRYPEAAQLVGQVAYRERMGVASQKLLDTVERNAEIMRIFERDHASELIADMLALADAPRAFSGTDRLVMFTGQLGTGGAERQLTRIACAYQKRAEVAPEATTIPQVWVRHANPATGADFYLPMLREAGVTTRILFEEPEVPIASLPGVPDTLKEMLEMLAPDLRRHVGQLVTMFREHKTDVAYLWQDGGIVQSAIAAVVAGVPRIVTSFRGLPPNLRPHFFREELPVLYAALARLPHVTFTANSQKTANAYEDWLDLPSGTVVVIPNAIPAVLPDGDETDHEFWFNVLTASPTCTGTVLGVFRFDENKRPLHWIEAAARYLQTSDDTRFVMLGNGHLFEACAARIAELGLGDRIFLAGIRSNVGFYMHRADIVMHLARMEGLPNVLIEAQLAGTPVLATPAGGTDEVVEDGETGVLLSTADELPEGELDDALQALLASPNLLSRMSEAATEHSGERFSADRILQRTSDLFTTDTTTTRQDTE